MNIDWQEVYGGRRQGINVAVLDEMTGDVLQMKSFDTHSSESASNNLAVTIENINPGQLVMVGVSGRGSMHLNDRSRRAIRTLGSGQIHQLGHTGSWALIGIKGAIPGTAVELVSNQEAHVSAEVQLQPRRKFGKSIKVNSGGFDNGNYADIMIGEEEVSFQTNTGSHLGLNVAVFNEISGEIIQAQVFDTHSPVSADYSPSDRFADFIKSLPNGRIVAIAVKGDGAQHLSERAKVASESIGSHLVRQLLHGSSWAIVGRKGAAVGTVPESASHSEAAHTVGFLQSYDPSLTTCTVTATGNGFLNEQNARGNRLGGLDAKLTVGNNVLLLFPNSHPRGINIAVVEESRCGVDTRGQFDTNGNTAASQRLIDYINNIPSGRIVIAEIFDEASRQLNEAAKRALESIGSGLIRNIQYRDAWAIIGRKSAAPGSVPEGHDRYTISVGATLPLMPTTTESCDSTLYPLNCHS